MHNTLLNGLIGLTGLALGACGGGGTADPNDPPPTSAGQAIVTSATRTAMVEDKGGGFIPAPPVGSTCLPGARKFTVTFASSTLDSAVCVGSSTTPYKTQTATHTLTAAEMAEVRTVLDGLKVVARTMQCAADASILGVTVTTFGGTREYIDDLNQCTDESKPLLSRTAIGAALNKLAALSTSYS